MSTPTPTMVPAELAATLRYGPFHRALHVAIEHRGLSLSRLSAHLARRGTPVAASTLSYWQRALRHPEVPRSLPAVRALEEILELPANALVVLIGPRTRPAGGGAGVSFAELAGSWGRAAELLSPLEPQHTNPHLEVVSAYDSVRLDAGGGLRRGTSRLVVRSPVAGADRYFAVACMAEIPDVAGIGIRALDGCRVGRVRRAADSSLVVAELLFDRRLGEQETHVFGYRIDYPDSLRSDGIYRTLRHPCETYLLQLVFHRKAVPVRCQRYVREREGTEPLEQEELVCAAGDVVSAYFSGVGPGLAGIALEWD